MPRLGSGSVSWRSSVSLRRLASRAEPRHPDQKAPYGVRWAQFALWRLETCRGLVVGPFHGDRVCPCVDWRQGQNQGIQIRKLLMELGGRNSLFGALRHAEAW